MSDEYVKLLDLKITRYKSLVMIEVLYKDDVLSCTHNDFKTIIATPIGFKIILSQYNKLLRSSLTIDENMPNRIIVQNFYDEQEAIRTCKYIKEALKLINTKRYVEWEVC